MVLKKAAAQSSTMSSVWPGFLKIPSSTWMHHSREEWRGWPHSVEHLVPRPTPDDMLRNGAALFLLHPAPSAEQTKRVVHGGTIQSPLEKAHARARRSPRVSTVMGRNPAALNSTPMAPTLILHAARIASCAQTHASRHKVVPTQTGQLRGIRQHQNIAYTIRLAGPLSKQF